MKFLSSKGHHLLVAVEDSGDPVGFVSGVEATHPDKGTEMFLYELSVAESHRNQWVGTEPDNAAAIATYRAAGAADPEPFVTLDWIFDDRSSRPESGPTERANAER